MNKDLLIRISAILLSALMVLGAVACGNTSAEADGTTAANTSAITEDETDYIPDIEVTDYDAEFNIITGHSVPAEKVVLESLDKSEAGDVEIAVYERGIQIKEHLGVTLVMQDGGDWMRYADTVMRSVSGGSDDYQLVLTNVYYGVAPFVASATCTILASWTLSIWTPPTGRGISWRTSVLRINTISVTVICASPTCWW